MEDSTSANTRHTLIQITIITSHRLQTIKLQTKDGYSVNAKARSVYISPVTPNSPKYYYQTYENIELCYDTDIDEEL